MLKLGRCWPIKTVSSHFSYASTAYVVASALVSVRLFCKNLSNLRKFFGQIVYPPPHPPPPLQKTARTPMKEKISRLRWKHILVLYCQMFNTQNYILFSLEFILVIFLRFCEFPPRYILLKKKILFLPPNFSTIKTFGKSSKYYSMKDSKQI